LRPGAKRVKGGKWRALSQDVLWKPQELQHLVSTPRRERHQVQEVSHALLVSIYLLVSVYGSKMAAGKCAVGSGAAVVPSAVVSKGLASTSRVVGVNGSGFESDEEEDMKGRITAQDKWGQFDDDCNVASSGTFNGK